MKTNLIDFRKLSDLSTLASLFGIFSMALGLVMFFQLNVFVGIASMYLSAYSFGVAVGLRNINELLSEKLNQQKKDESKEGTNQ